MSRSAAQLEIRSIYQRPVALSALLLAQILFISLLYDASRPDLVVSSAWFGFLAYAGQFAKVLVAVLVFSVIGLLPRLPAHFTVLGESTERYPARHYLVGQLLCFAFFVWCTDAIFGQGADVAAIPDILVLGWMIALIATGWLWLLALAPLDYWRGLLKSETRVVVAALLVGLLAWVVAGFAEAMWTPLSELTFALSASILGLFYPEIIVSPEFRTLGTREFYVNIAPQCSGYEGMGLMAIFTGFYLSIYRNEFRFPQALLLFPLGLVTIWVFNNLRIVALISIGISYSPEVAVGGFHSQAGWISFIVVTVGMLMLAYRMPFFSTAPVARQSASDAELTLPVALLLPFVVLLAATMLTSASSAGFDWLYPLRVVAVGAALAYCWRCYRLRWPAVRLEPYLAGGAVFLVWILLVPNDPERNAEIGGALGQAGWALASMWILWRALGAVVTVPIAEELLFRGYLLARLARQQIALDGRIAFSWVALIGSSVLFGLLHADWFAGIVAGLAFGWVRYRGGSILDAIAAHAFTNLLLTIYVIATGHWSMW